MLMFAAAIIFFTRLPIWRWVTVPSESFQKVIYYWSFTGWITSFFSIITLLITAYLLPLPLSIALTIVSRVLLTGGFHEDGLADFLDGFGGGQTKDRILSIMKDSYTGTYAVLGLIFYFLILYNIFNSLTIHSLILMIFMADPFCKMLSALTPLRLTYARTTEASKIQAIYALPSTRDILITLTFGLMPILIVMPFLSNLTLLMAFIAPLILFFVLTQWMKSKINGYTGDCVGALFLLLELSFMLAFVAIHHQL